MTNWGHIWGHIVTMTIDNSMYIKGLYARFDPLYRIPTDAMLTDYRLMSVGYRD